MEHGGKMTAVMLEEYGGPEVLTLVQRDIPRPGPGELLVRMEAAGVSKPDFLMRTGAYPWTRGRLPFYPGLCGAGVVTEIGGDVQGFCPGEMVFIDHPVVCSCYAEYKVVPAELATKVPSGVAAEDAAVMTNHVIAWSMLENAVSPSEGKTIYIKGAAGALGTALVQLAPMRGLRVIASASTPEKCAYLRQLGADGVFCYREEGEQEALSRLTDGHMADFVLDQCCGAQFASRLDLLARCGTVVIYNTLDGFPQENTVEQLTARFARCCAVRAFSFHLHDGHPEELRRLRGEVFALLAEGKISPRIGAAFPLEEVRKAHHCLDRGDTLGSIVLKMGSSR